MNQEKYLFSYLDRRMNQLITEWELVTSDEIVDLNDRYHDVQYELSQLKLFEKELEGRIGSLESRILKIKEYKSGTA